MVGVSLDREPSTCRDAVNEISTPRVILGTIKIVLIVFIMHVPVYARRPLILRHKDIGLVLVRRRSVSPLDNECCYIA